MKFWTTTTTTTVLAAAAWLHVARAVPSGFSNRQIFKGSFMTDLAFTSEEMGHLMFVVQKRGLVYVYEPGDKYEYNDEDKTEALDIIEQVCYENERGLGGFQLHPEFDKNHIVYTYYTFPKFGNCDEDAETGPVNRLSRWIYDPDSKKIDPHSEVVLLDTLPTGRAYHNGGKIEFGKDGYLYLSIGDMGRHHDSERVNNLIGGMIRLTDMGDIPADNPFAGDPDAVRCNEDGSAGSDEQKCLELYAIGFRNPFRFSMDPNTKGDKVRFFVNDVGSETWEEISEGGDDYKNDKWEHDIQHFGWPEFEGPCRRVDLDDCDQEEGYIRPVHFYQHQGGGAVTAGAFVPNGFWKEEYDNKYLYADFMFGKMYVFGEGEVCTKCSPTESNKDPEVFLSHASIVTMKFGPYVDGNMALYYTSIDDGGVMHQVVCDDCSVVPGDSGATAAPSPLPTTAPTDLSRPEGEGGYPGALFPWKSGADCPAGYDYCGVLEFCMEENTQGIDIVTVYGYRLPCLEGACECPSVPGPLIRLMPGHKYKMTLRNAGTEVTNLHTHGLHIVGDGDGDDVTREVMGGGNCLDYTWDIKADHPGGTNWYHAHHHGISEKQVGGGAYGMLIVEDNKNLDPVLPTWTGNELLLQVAANVNTGGIISNGRKAEVIDIAAKQWYRLRVSLAITNALPYNLTFDDDDMCDIHKVAQDGVWRSVVPGPKSSVWELTGASRADFAIRCNTSETLIPVFFRDNERVAQIWVGSKEQNPHVMEEFKPNRPYSLSDMLNEKVPQHNRFSVRLGFNYVNDKDWNPVEPIATIGYDQVHEWTLMQTWYHPFHLHLYHMQIITPGGCGPHEEGEFYDTIAAPGNCTIRFRTADIGQRCVLHCHVLLHEDSGSMSWVNVTGKKMPMNTKRPLEYMCPASTLPIKSCVPGFLGITTDTPLLDGEEFVNKEYGVYIRQQRDGNLVVYRGTPANQGEVVWAHGVMGNDTDTTCFTKLSKDSNLATLVGAPGNEGKVMWETGTVNPDGRYFLGIDCKSEIVSVYAGDPNGRSSAVSVWNSVPTSAPTISPTVSPTSVPTSSPTSLPTSLPTSGPTASPTSSPTGLPTSAPTKSPTDGPTTSPTGPPTGPPTPAPTSSPTDGPTQSPTERCVPGYLGISTGNPLLDGEEFINEEYGVYIKQQKDGNLVVRRGTPESWGQVVWAHNKLGKSNLGYFTLLKRNSNLITLEGHPNDGQRSDREILWRSATINPLGEYFLGIDCTSEVVSIYAGGVKDDLSDAILISNLAEPHDDDDKNPARHLRTQQ